MWIPGRIVSTLVATNGKIYKTRESMFSAYVHLFVLQSFLQLQQTTVGYIHPLVVVVLISDYCHTSSSFNQPPPIFRVHVFTFPFGLHHLVASVCSRNRASFFIFLAIPFSFQTRGEITVHHGVDKEAWSHTSGPSNSFLLGTISILPLLLDLVLVPEMAHMHSYQDDARGLTRLCHHQPGLCLSFGQRQWIFGQ